LFAGESPGEDETKFSSIYFKEEEDEFELSPEPESSELSPSIMTNFIAGLTGPGCLGNASGSIKAASKSSSLTLAFTIC
jgi:hypothetical protein